MKAAVRALAPLAVLSAMAMAGCAQDVGDIVRVQPNFVKKSDFEGQWYIRNTIAEVPPQVQFSFVGYTLDMEKVCWEITEDHLIGFRSYELHPGKNPAAEEVEAGGCVKDAPVVAYRIKSHFDIQRGYNPATGEQTNVISENASDRAWYDRAFMRVDWAQNVVTNFTGNAGGNFDFAEYVPSNSDDQWSFRMESATGESLNAEVEDPEVFKRLFAEDRPEVDYIDYTQRMMVKPPVYNFVYGGRQYSFPMCMLGSSFTVDCTAGEVKVRTSMLRVPEGKTYEPRFYDDERMQKFGYFRTERSTYDDHYGHTDAGELKYANLHNIWETAYDADGNLLPARNRTPKPVVYTLSPGYPAELVADAEETARGWSKALTRAVAAAQGRTVEQVAAEFPYEDAEGNYLNTGMFRLDYNEDGHARIGDLRYNFIYWVANPHQSSPLGYGPASADPETGEVIAAQAFMYGASLDAYAQLSLDMVKALNGDLALDEEFQAGDYVREYIEANRVTGDPQNLVSALGTEAVLDRPVADLNLERVSPEGALQLEAARQFGLDSVQEDLARRMARLDGTSLEARMINDEIRGVLAAQTGDLQAVSGPVDDQLLELARPLTLDAGQILERDQIRLAWAAKNSVWLADFADGTMEGLARYMAQQDWTEEEQYQWVRAKIFRAVTEHEVGHTLGLRHNFQGSYDAINFFPEYWDLRKENIRPYAEVRSYGDLLSMAAQTPTQIDGRMREFEYSSIMDYGARFNTDFNGLGSYDEAAIVFGYADFVEYFTEPGAQFKDRLFATYSDGTPRFEDIGSLAYDQLLDVSHYTQMPYLMGDGNPELGIARFQKRAVMPYETLRSMREEGFSERPVEVPYMFCSDEWVGAVNSCHRWDQGADLLEQTRTVTEGWKNHFWFNNFRRNRLGWTPYDTFARSYSRYFGFLPGFYIHWLFNAAYNQYDNTAAGQAAGMYSQLAVYDGLNFLMDAVTTPSYGSYKFDPEQPNTLRLVTTELDAADTDFTVPMGVGRRDYTRYDYGSGYYFFQYPKEAGHFWDYMAALRALATSSATFRGVEVQSNFNEYSLPYYMIFGDELARRFNAIITEQEAPYAPRAVPTTSGDTVVVSQPVVDYMGLFTGSQPMLDASALPVVSPDLNWTDRFYAMLYGAIGFRRNDVEYIDQHRVFRVGSGETLQPATGWEMRTFESESRGVVYGALAKTGATENGPAVEFIEQANALQAQRQAALEAGDDETAENLGYQIDAIVEWLDMERAFYDIFGRAL